ncbi:pyridoxamine 5'-phosphate oxidase family protein [Clostridium sp. 19966]|uniref:pyridoxamine 5'-phosphate oxidase family protein n=1 Tax=Clostridium sp. 19966 TaxID=2768166 RepID=UPI0028DD94E9|nr:pyridoxamine 5'-phosphate oxidase family protein [Clostridium sp. 19966]MDT8717714.1 pyridoxamine 5'-phosphate oxidase family protein [Clostridium sp. 19966]
MKEENVILKALELANSCKFAMVGSNGEDGFPNIKSMIKIENEGLEKVWFSTNTSTKRVAQFRENPKACVYFSDFDNWSGLMLVGNIEVIEEPKIKERFWSEGCEVYYPLGVTDPDYCILCFTPKWGNYYKSLHNTTFEIGS